ncbi:MAG: SIMPL domain-containing protein [Alphaproteobacteria bacterium]|nr:SIMPL domain-containing protein [Alphaproteobacteria bacterium]
MIRLRPLLLTAAAVVLSGAVSTAVLAQPTPGDPAASSISRTITVSGSGHTEMAPDIAVLSLGVTSDGATAREALDKNSGAMGAVIDGLKELGFGVTDMQTTGLSVNAQYDYNTQPARLIGYLASNGITLRVKDISRLGEILDIVVSKGSNQINGLSFDVADKTAAMNEARLKAVADAKAKADLLAGAAGMTVGRVITMSEGYVSSPSPVPVQTMRADSAASVPTAAGQVGLDALVNIVYELN